MAKAHVRIRHCARCGKVETVGKYSKAMSCLNCSATAALVLARAARASKREKHFKTCVGCFSLFRSAPKSGRIYCSDSCRYQALHVARTCKRCGAGFVVRRKATGAGNFCSRPCYHQFLCATDRTNDRGSRWRVHRAEAVERAPFCAVCGAARVQVHHIIPYRLTRDNRQVNLIPLCPSDHKRTELIFAEFENSVGPQSRRELDELMLLWRASMAATQLATALRLQGDRP